MADSEIGMWWFRPGKSLTNFGDELGPQIVSRLGYPVTRLPIDQAELISCGSVLGLVPSVRYSRLSIWGSGFLLPGDTLKGKPDIIAVRGSLTARKLKVNAPLGDPGILVPLLWPRTKQPIHKVGVIPHYVDKNQYSWADKVINPMGNVDTVIEEIQSCRSIASSSLHGLIVASAYGIPTVRLYHPKVIGDEFKWVDYLSGIAGKSLEQTQQELIGALKSWT